MVDVQNAATQPRARRGWLLSRRLTQAVCLLIVILALISTTGVGVMLGGKSLIKALLAMDPLSALATAIAAARGSAWAEAGHWLLYALPFVLVTMLFGRVFCGWLCPMGTCIDITDRVLFRKRPDRVASLAWVKYGVLAACLLAACFGHTLLYVFDPLPLFIRTMTVAVLPLGGGVVKPLQHAMPNADFAGWFGLGFQLNVLAAALFALILTLGLWGRRVWCRTLCPLGAFLGLCARIAPFGRKLTDACRHCQRCVAECRMSATTNGATAKPAECVTCGACAAVCPTGLVKFGARAPGQRERQDLGRRRLLTAAVTGVAWAGLARTGALSRVEAQTGATGNDRLLRPPAALPEDDFLAKKLFSNCQIA